MAISRCSYTAFVYSQLKCIVASSEKHTCHVLDTCVELRDAPVEYMWVSRGKSSDQKLAPNELHVSKPALLSGLPKNVFLHPRDMLCTLKKAFLIHLSF